MGLRLGKVLGLASHSLSLFVAARLTGLALRSAFVAVGGEIGHTVLELVNRGRWGE